VKTRKTPQIPPIILNVNIYLPNNPQSPIEPPVCRQAGKKKKSLAKD